MGPENVKVVLAVLLFAATLLLVIRQPRGLGIGWSAAGGAVLAVLAHVVSWQDVLEVTGIVWDATITFIGIILISLILDEIGFFEWAALHMARLARGSGIRMFFYVILLGAAVAAFFSNDGAALILTPIVLAMMRELKLEQRLVLPFVMASGFIADTTSLPFTISNLVNLISADYFGVGFVRYACRMIVVDLVSLAASAGVLLLFFRKQLPGKVDPNQLRRPAEAIKDPLLFRLSWGILGVLLLAYSTSPWAHIHVAFIESAAAIVLVLATIRREGVNTKQVMKDAPWSVVVFSIGMYVVVYGLRNAGLTDWLGVLLQDLANQGVLAASVGGGFIAAFLSSSMNNLPAVMIDALAIHGTQAQPIVHEAMVYANVIGSDLGPKITPIGSLATLLWLHVLAKKGIKITWGQYVRTGIALTIPVLFVTLLGLALWLKAIAWMANLA